MIGRDIRHLLIRNTENGKIENLLSIKDLVKVVAEIQKARIDLLRETAVGGVTKRENAGDHEI